MLFWTAVLGIIVLATFYSGVVKANKKIWNVVDTPTVTPTGSIIGLCEVNGISSPLILPDGKSWPILKSPLTETECVWFYINLEELRKSGKSSSWHSIGSYCSKLFSIKDDYGHVIVETDSAVGSDAVLAFNSQEVYVGKAQQYLKTVVQESHMSSLMSSLGFSKPLRVSEYVIKNSVPIYAHGEVSVWDNGFDLVMRGSDGAKSDPDISTSGEDGLLKRLKTSRAINTFLTTVLFFGFIWLAGSQLKLEKPYIYAVVITAISSLIYYFLFRFIRVYNRFINLRQQVDLGRSTIDVNIKRRNDLIPMILNVVDQSAKHVQEVQTIVARIRTMNLDQYSPQISLLAEAYPDFNTSDNFLQLQKELARSEEKVAMSRSYVNDSVTAMDNLRATLFGMIFSPLFAKEHRITS